jgi:hypothetical protein
MLARAGIAASGSVRQQRRDGLLRLGPGRQADRQHGDASQAATARTPALTALRAARPEAGGTEPASASAIRTVAFQVRNSLAVK